MSDEDEVQTPTVTLGYGDEYAHTFRVIAQPHAYLLPRISGVLAAMFGGDGVVTPEAVAAKLGDGVYDALTGFLPDLPQKIKRWEFMGYSTREKCAEGGEKDIARQTPTLPQIAEAIETGINVNGREVLESIFVVVDPKDLREMVTDRLRAWNEVAVLRTSLNSLAASGESARTSSGEPPQIEALNGSESPSLASSN